MNIRLISITSFAIMFLTVAFMPFELAMVVVFGVFCILISCGAIYACRKIYDVQPDEPIDFDNFVCPYCHGTQEFKFADGEYWCSCKPGSNGFMEKKVVKIDERC